MRLRRPGADSTAEALPTVLSHVSAHLDPSGVGLLPGGEDLPDSKPSTANELSWAPGAWDGVVTHHVGKDSASDAVEPMFTLIARTINKNFRSADFGKLYELTRSDDLVASIDDLLIRLRSSGLPAAGIRQVGERLAREGRHREPVKLGIALLGLIAGDPERKLLLTLGRHDEFTLYSAVAIANTEPNETRDQVLMALAKSVDGWGRIHVVERLAGSDDLEVQNWLLRGGFRNSIMNEYLAYIAATTGKLADALAPEDVDDELIDSAGELISALVNGGPAEDIDDYSEGATAVEHFIDIVERREMKLSHFVTVDDLSQFLAREDGWDDRADNGWRVELRTSLANRCNAIKASPGWADLVTAGLASDDVGIFYDADRTARTLGIDTFPAHWKRLQADPLGGNWFSVMQGIDDRRLVEVLDFAREVLPLDRLGSGPNSSASDEFRVHTALEFVVTQLSRFPGQGWDLLAVCLRSPVIRSRNMAINTLESWPQSAWPPEARTALADALAAEPEEKVRERLASLTHFEAKP